MKKDEYTICAREECEAPFLKAVHNQLYCGPECTRIATNERLIRQYHEKKARKQKGKRICSRKGCDTILSQYNKEPICETCKTARFLKRLKSWGWDTSRLEL